MRLLNFALLLQLLAVTFALYLSYQVGMAFYSQQYQILDIVADVGSILICIDLAVFLWHSRKSEAVNLQEYAQKMQANAPKWVKFSRKLGHFGILLILTSWIVPMINS